MWPTIQFRNGLGIKAQFNSRSYSCFPVNVSAVLTLQGVQRCIPIRLLLH